MFVLYNFSCFPPPIKINNIIDIWIQNQVKYLVLPSSWTFTSRNDWQKRKRSMTNNRGGNAGKVKENALSVVSLKTVIA